MDLSAWVLYTFIAALLIAASVAHYRWREPGGSGRTILGVTRGAALALIVLLLFDPTFPVGGAPDRSVVALVDASLSMSLTDEEGRSRWDRARELVAASGATRVQLFGGGEEGPVPDLEEVAPSATRSRLAPALRSVLEAGVSRVVVITDGAVEDAADVGRLMGESSVPVEVQTVGAGMPTNFALEEVDAPRWLEVGEPAVVRYTVGRAGAAGAAFPDSVTVTLTRADRELGRAQVAVPPPGRGSSGELRFRPESGADGAVRLDLAIEPGGAVADDDVRAVYVRIAEEPAGVALVSFRPDQEPRFLLPVLDRALALPVRGWIGLSDDRFLTLGTGQEAGVVTTGASVRRAVTEAALVVLHGVDDTAPAWARAAMAEGERVLVFPADPVPPLPVGPAPYREGDWYLAPEVPSSPVAALLAGIQTGDVPPLTGLRPVPLPDGYWTPLVARSGRQGEAYPVAKLGAPAGRRVAVALGAGYWRWAFAGAEGRAVYERFWSAVAGWLTEDVAGTDREVIRPVSRVVGRGARVDWMTPAADDSIAIRIEAEVAAAEPNEGEAVGVVVDTTVVVEGGRAATGALAPGHYRYTARSPSGGSVEGAFTVESYSTEFMDSPGALDHGVSGTGEVARSAIGRPLRTSPWPYVLVVGLLCAEWVLRRRWGLR